MTQADLFDARDRTLAKHASKHASIIAVATTFALRLAAARGTVTSVEVLNAMHAEGWAEELERTDRRFMGAVLLPSKGWERVGLDRTGSKGRPVTVWRRR